MIENMSSELFNKIVNAVVLQKHYKEVDGAFHCYLTLSGGLTVEAQSDTKDSAYAIAREKVAMKTDLISHELKFAYAFDGIDFVRIAARRDKKKAKEYEDYLTNLLQ